MNNGESNLIFSENEKKMKKKESPKISIFTEFQQKKP